jgi:hypothetical protein
MQQNDSFTSRNTLLAQRLLELKTSKVLNNEKFKMTSEKNDNVLKVRDNATGFLVAYSSMQVDYAQSAEEFIYDYFLSTANDILDVEPVND